eukprot:COSAG01_NODE_33740_length_559_cov_1.286957_1_plen_111_part_01
MYYTDLGRESTQSGWLAKQAALSRDTVRAAVAGSGQLGSTTYTSLCTQAAQRCLHFLDFLCEGVAGPATQPRARAHRFTAVRCSEAPQQYSAAGAINRAGAERESRAGRDA